VFQISAKSASLAATPTETRKSHGILGASISGAWPAGAVGEGLAFFVDGDPAR
jgi:hypothetical protein